MRKMRLQTTIFDDPIARSHHAKHLTNDATICNTVFAALTIEGLTGATAQELACMTGLRQMQVAPALGELRKWGRIRKSEAKRMGQSVYYVVTP